MKKLLLPILATAFIIISEVAPFFYEVGYTMGLSSWAWIIGALILLFVSYSYSKKQEKQADS